MKEMNSSIEIECSQKVSSICRFKEQIVNNCEMDSSDDEIQKQQHQNREVQSERSYHLDITKRKMVNLSSDDESVKHYEMDSSDDERQKQQHQNRRIQSERSCHLDITKRKTVNLSSGDESVKHCEIDSSYDERQRHHHQNRRMQSERPHHVDLKQIKKVNVTSGGESLKKSGIDTSYDQKQMLQHGNRQMQSEIRPQHVDLTKRKKVNVPSGGESLKKSGIDTSYDKKLMLQHGNRQMQSEIRPQHVDLTKRKIVSVPSGDESVKARVVVSYSDYEMEKQQHQNSCLQSEMPQRVIMKRKIVGAPSGYHNVYDFESDISLGLSSPIKTKTDHLAKTLKFSKISDMWVDVLRKSEERSSCIPENVQSMKDSECKINYEEMLVDFVLEVIKKVRVSNGETQYERWFRNKLRKPKFWNFRSEFYIPPTQVELFYQMLTDLSAQECLRVICKVRNWSPLRYITVQSRDRFFTTCILKRKKFTSRKSTSNSQFSKELAAFHCLNFLGLTMRKVKAFNRYLNEGCLSE